MWRPCHLHLGVGQGGDNPLTTDTASAVRREGTTRVLRCHSLICQLMPRTENFLLGDTCKLFSGSLWSLDIKPVPPAPTCNLGSDGQNPAPVQTVPTEERKKSNGTREPYFNLLAWSIYERDTCFPPLEVRSFSICRNTCPHIFTLDTQHFKL